MQHCFDAASLSMSSSVSVTTMSLNCWLNLFMVGQSNSTTNKLPGWRLARKGFASSKAGGKSGLFFFSALFWLWKLQSWHLLRQPFDGIYEAFIYQKLGFILANCKSFVSKLMQNSIIYKIANSQKNFTFLYFRHNV